MLVALGLVPLFIVIAIIWPIVAIAKQQERSKYTFLLALNLVLGYVLISPLGNQPRAPFGEMLGFALAFMGAFVAHVVIWRRYPERSWWSPPDVWPPTRQASHEHAKSRERQFEGSAPLQ